MPTLYDLSRMMGGSGSRVGSTTPSRDASVGGVSGGQSGSSSSVRYGYALADSAGGWVTVQLDTGQLVGGAESVACVCDSPISQGQRVAVDVMPNGQLKARPIGTNIIDSAVDQAGENVGKVVVSVVTEWAGSNSGSTEPTAGWSEEMPTGYDYVWQRTTTTYKDGSVSHSPGVVIQTPLDLPEQMETVYATSSTASGASAKTATVQSGSLTLQEGATVQVTFTNANTASSPTLNVGGTGARPVYTNGSREAWWDAGATVTFVYDGSAWQVASSPVYASEVTVGNPTEDNVKITPGQGVAIRDGSSNMSVFGRDKIDLGLNSDASEVTMMGGTFHILAVSDGIAYGSKRLYLKPVDYEGPTGNPTYDLVSLQISANTFLRFHATGTNGLTTAELASTDDMDITSYNGPLKVACDNGNTSISGDGIWMGTTGSIVKPGGMMGGNNVGQSLPSQNTIFDSNSYYDCFTGDNVIGGNSAVICRSNTITGNDYSIDDYMYIWLPKAKGSNPQPTPVLVSGMAYAANVNNTNFAASIEVTRYSGGGSLMSQGTLSMGVQTGSSLGAFCSLTCPSALVMLGRSTSGPTVYRMRMIGRSSNGSATLQSWYMTAHLM